MRTTIPLLLSIMGAFAQQSYAGKKIKVVTDDAELRKIADTYRSNPNRSKDFIPQANGTVIDKRTGLQWMRCSLGQKWTGKKCVGQSKKYDWQEVNNTFREFAGHNGWRLPTIKAPTIIQDIFPNTTPYWYWSSSPDKFYSTQMWGLNFNNGTTDFLEKDKKFYFRLVRTPK